MSDPISVAFLRPVAESLVGTFALVPQVADAVSIPVIAAALTLGADGVQIGTGFLATAESGASAVHKAALHGPDAKVTVLTRLFSGRPAGHPEPAGPRARRARGRRTAVPGAERANAADPPRRGPQGTSRPREPVGRPGGPAHLGQRRTRLYRRPCQGDRGGPAPMIVGSCVAPAAGIRPRPTWAWTATPRLSQVDPLAGLSRRAMLQARPRSRNHRRRLGHRDPQARSPRLRRRCSRSRRPGLRRRVRG